MEEYVVVFTTLSPGPRNCRPFFNDIEARVKAMKKGTVEPKKLKFQSLFTWWLHQTKSMVHKPDKEKVNEITQRISTYLTEKVNSVVNMNVSWKNCKFSVKFKLYETSEKVQDIQDRDNTIVYSYLQSESVRNCWKYLKKVYRNNHRLQRMNDEFSFTIAQEEQSRYLFNHTF